MACRAAPPAKAEIPCLSGDAGYTNLAVRRDKKCNENSFD
jgi:hypothetical protein